MSTRVPSCGMRATISAPVRPNLYLNALPFEIDVQYRGQLVEVLRQPWGEVLRLVPPHFPDVDLFKRTEFELVHFTCCIFGSCPEWS